MKSMEIAPSRAEKKDTLNPKREIIEMAGKRNIDESIALMQKTLSSLRLDNKNGEGRIHKAETIDQIDTKGGKLAHFVEGGIEYHRLKEGTVICTSDIHGDFSLISKALDDFIAKKEAGEKIYFNFSGDICTSDTGDSRMAVIESLIAAKACYPQEVFFETGNGDRGDIPLFAGLGSEIIKTHLGDEVYRQFKEKARESLDQLMLEQHGMTVAQMEELSDPEEREKYAKILSRARTVGIDTFIGATFAGEARARGAETVSPKRFSGKFIYEKLKNDIFGLGDKPSSILRNRIGRNLVSATGDYPVKSQIVADDEKMKKAFELYQNISQVVDSMPVMNIVSTPHGNIIFSHSWPVGTRNLNELVYDPIEQRRSAWNKFYADLPETEKKGEQYNYGPATLTEWFRKNNVVLGQFGHNHGNRITELGGMARMEVATTKRARKEKGELQEPAYGIIKIDKLDEIKNGRPKEAIEFRSLA